MALNAMYSGENQLQAINHKADFIEQETGIEVVRCHLGNPMGPQFEGTNHLLSRYYLSRGKDLNSSGYADVAGDKSARIGIAKALCCINRLPTGTLSEQNIIGVTGGTGALNIALSIFGDSKKKMIPIALISDPFYPPWLNIADRLSCEVHTFPLCENDNFMINRNILEEKIFSLNGRKIENDRPIILIYHYPHNPTGKTLNEKEAKEIANTLNLLCKQFPNLWLLQEDLYLATIAPELGLYTPLPYLDEETCQRTIWLHSPSKMGHQRDRAAVVAAFNKNLLLHLRGATSFDILGTSTPALIATANTLMHIAQGGINPINSRDSNVNNHRFITAQYYQERLKIVYEAFREIEIRTNEKILSIGMPQGAYYLYPSFNFMKGCSIPQSLVHLWNNKTKFENADDICLALANAHLLGLCPITVASGTLFTFKSNTMHIRISTIEPEIKKIEAGVNTIKGFIQKVLQVNLDATFSDILTLKELYPYNKSKKYRPKPPFRWNKSFNGEGREWTLNP
jgi:aspartate/methionine/tyrosine aminotransferase